VARLGRAGLARRPARLRGRPRASTAAVLTATRVAAATSAGGDLDDGEGRSTTTPVGIRFVGHSTVLLELPGLRILTDPFLRNRLGPLRRHGALPDAEELGRIDLVLLSHAHPDHFDRSSLRSLAGDPLVIVPRGLGRAVRRVGLRARELEIGEAAGIAAQWRVEAIAARHWRWPTAPRAAAIGFLLEGPGRTGIYFPGDTSRFPGMAALAGRVDLALLPVGRWGPHVSPGHLSPRTAAEVARDVGARFAVPVHWGTLYPAGLPTGPRLTEPATRFTRWAERVAPGLRVLALQPGSETTIEL
jgi:L-ascorbate metabolism protein UlaG (beta-lactamase superfamily)